MGIEITRALWFAPRLFLAAALTCVATACGAPGQVEGVVERQGFWVHDTAPASRWSSDGRLVVMLSEDDGQTLRVVSLQLLRAQELPEGKPIQIGPKDSGLPYLDVAQGELEVSLRSDGARILSTKDTRYSRATRGTVEIRWLDGDLQGTFHVELDDGGYLDGSFLAPIER